MAVDYIKQKVDFYKEYEGKKYEKFFNDEVNPAYNIITSVNNGAELQRKVRNVRENLNGLNLEWKDSVNNQFQSYILSCEEYLKTIEGSIEDQFIGLAEKAYKELYKLLGDLKQQNSDYQAKFDDKPLRTEKRFKIPAEYDETGKLIKSESFNSSAYDRAISDWEISVGELAGYCITTIASIEEQKTILHGVNLKVPNFENGDSSIDSSVPQFDGSLFNNNNNLLGFDGTVEEYIAANGLKYLKITQFGQEFYVLAPIKSTRTQETDQCLSYARANARAITEYNGYEIPQLGGKDNGCVYTSTDPNEIYKIMLNEYLNGRSVALEVNGSTKHNSRHFVSLIGFEAGTDFNNIQPQNALILDSTSTATVGYKQLNTENGGQMRYLKSASEMVNNSFGTDYTVIVYSDVDYSEMFPNTKIAPKDPYGASQSNKGDGAIVFA